jgi:hypothetical protein
MVLCLKGRSTYFTQIDIRTCSKRNTMFLNRCDLLEGKGILADMCLLIRNSEDIENKCDDVFCDQTSKKQLKMSLF